MATPPTTQPIWWNKLESLVSEIGVNASAIGTPTFVACKFNNGINLAVSANRAYVPIAVPTAWSMTFPYKMWFNQASPGSDRVLFGDYFDFAGGTPLAFQMWVDSAGVLNVYLINYLTGKGTYYKFTLASFVTNDIVSWGINFDAAATDKIRVRQNGNELSISAKVGNHAQDADTVYLMFGHGSLVAGVADNTIVFDYTISQENHEWLQNNESWQADGPTNLSASQGLPDKVSLTWDAVVGVGVEYIVYRTLADASPLDYQPLTSWISDNEYDDYTALSYKVYLYEVKYRINSVESQFSSPADGWIESDYVRIPYISGTIAPNTYRRSVQVTPAFHDIYGGAKYGCRIDKAIETEEYKTFNKDKVFQTEIEVQVKNFDDLFSPGNSASIFSASNNYPIVIRDDNGLVLFDGVVKRILRNHASKLATLYAEDWLAVYANKTIVYESSGWENPAQAFKNICAYVGFPKYSDGSISASSRVYESAGVQIKCRFTASDNITFQQAIEKISEIGVADIYWSINALYFTVSDVQITQGFVNISKDDMDISLMEVDEITDDVFNDYDITIGSQGSETTYRDATQDNIGKGSREKIGPRSLPTIDGTIKSQIQIKDETTAVWIGNSHIQRTHKTLGESPEYLSRFNFRLPYEFRSMLQLGSYLRITLSDEGWVDKPFEVSRIKRVMDEYIEITAREVSYAG